MNFLLALLAQKLVALFGPIDGFKSIIGIVLAVAINLARFYEVDIPTLDSSVYDFIYTILVGLGLGHKAGKVEAR